MYRRENSAREGSEGLRKGQPSKNLGKTHVVTKGRGKKEREGWKGKEKRGQSDCMGRTGSRKQTRAMSNGVKYLVK